MSPDVSALANDDEPDRNHELTDDVTEERESPPQQPDLVLFCFRCGGVMSDSDTCPRCQWRICVTCGN